MKQRLLWNAVQKNKWNLPAWCDLIKSEFNFPATDENIELPLIFDVTGKTSCSNSFKCDSNTYKALDYSKMSWKCDIEGKCQFTIGKQLIHIFG